MSKNNHDVFAAKRKINLLSVVVPIFNEIQTCEIALNDLYVSLKESEIEFEIVVVESNSTDGTRNVLRKLKENIPFRLIEEEAPRGKGAAVRRGFDECSGDVYLIFDGDREYSPQDITKLVAALEAGKSSFILGSRHGNRLSVRKIEGARFVSFFMNFGHFALNKLLGLAIRDIKLRDPFTMYKLFRKEIFENVELRSNRFDLDWELVIIAVRMGARPLEIPINYNSRGFDDGKKIRLIRDPFNWVRAFLIYGFTPIKKSLH